MIKKIQLYPKHSVNDLEYDKKIEGYLQKYSFVIEKGDDEVPKWDTYSIQKLGIDVYVEDEIIVSIACRKTLTYKKTELIGSDISTIIKILGVDYSDKDQIYLNEEDIPHDVYDFDSYGIQVWEKEQKIDCIFCSKGEDAD